MENAQIEFATLLQRVKALMIDLLVIVGLFVAFSQFIEFFGEVSDTATKIIIVLIFTYDPLFTSIFGGTVGHLLIGIRVKRKNSPSKNIILPLAILRYVLKTSLGWISLLTVTSSKNRQALHDISSKSIVRLK